MTAATLVVVDAAVLLTDPPAAAGVLTQYDQNGKGIGVIGCVGAHVLDLSRALSEAIGVCSVERIGAGFARTVRQGRPPDPLGDMREAMRGEPQVVRSDLVLPGARVLVAVAVLDGMTRVLVAGGAAGAGFVLDVTEVFAAVMLACAADTVGAVG